MSSGQIRSYISFIDDNSDDAYIKRIKNLIDEFDDEKEKQILKVEFSNKLNQIAIIKKYKTQYTPKPEIKNIPKEEYIEKDDDILYEPRKTTEEKLFLSEVYEDKLPIIKAPLYALMHIASMPCVLTKGLPSNHDAIAKKYNIPKKPIYDEKVS